MEGQENTENTEDTENEGTEGHSRNDSQGMEGQSNTENTEITENETSQRYKGNGRSSTMDSKDDYRREHFHRDGQGKQDRKLKLNDKTTDVWTKFLLKSKEKSINKTLNWNTRDGKRMDSVKMDGGLTKNNKTIKPWKVLHLFNKDSTNEVRKNPLTDGKQTHRFRTDGKRIHRFRTDGKRIHRFKKDGKQKTNKNRNKTKTHKEVIWTHIIQYRLKRIKSTRKDYKDKNTTTRKHYKDDKTTTSLQRIGPPRSIDRKIYTLMLTRTPGWGVKL